MKILALEFSSQLRSAAVADVKEKRTLLSSYEDADFRGVTGMTLIERALHAAAIQPPEISLIALGLGPGSYTGIRSAIAIAQGWHLGSGVRVVGLSSTLCLAEEARRRGLSGEVTLVIDAQRGEVYIQKYRLDAQTTELEPLRIASTRAISPEGLVIGPEASKFAPSGVDLCPAAGTLAQLADPGLAVPPEQLEPIYLRTTSFVKAPPPRLIV